jgi:DNA-binding NarL/FixJ family response regulator
MDAMAPTRPGGQVRVLLVSPTRIYREGLSYVLATDPAVAVVGTAASVDDALTALATADADVTLFDLRTESGLVGVRRLVRDGRQRVVVLGVTEDEPHIVACAEAGIAGYLTDADSLSHMMRTIQAAARGDFSCPPQIAGGLLRRLAAVVGPVPVPGGPHITVRERQVVVLIGQGLTNKEIAKRLGIQLATVKNHVHNILDKTGLSRRSDAAASLGQTPVRREA